MLINHKLMQIHFSHLFFGLAIMQILEMANKNAL
jgi:hypothetical protein